MPFRPFPPAGFNFPVNGAGAVAGAGAGAGLGGAAIAGGVAGGSVASMVPGASPNFNGMSVSSTTFYTKDKDGNLVKDGGTTLLINDNGNIHHMSRESYYIFRKLSTT